MKTKTEHIHARIAPEQAAALDRISREENVSVVSLVRQAIGELTKVPDPLRKTTRGRGIYEGNNGNPYMRKPDKT